MALSCGGVLACALVLCLLAFPCPSMQKNLSTDCVDGSATSGSIGGIGFGFGYGTYLGSCPEVERIVLFHVRRAIALEPRMAASLLRLHFHDCFVNGCDASVLLDDTENFVGEKTAGPNLNSLRGFEVIDEIKSDIESACPQTVSCADILAIVARDSVVLTGGPSWDVQTGRRDSLSASKTAANSNIPSPNSNVATLVSNFQNVGLALNDMVALSGAHTVGKARCASFSSRLQGTSNSNQVPDINVDFLQSLQELCSNNADSNATLAHLDYVSPSTFDNQYYVNLVSGEGLLASDATLVTGGDNSTRAIVETYANDIEAFFEDFKKSMVRMGGLRGGDGEIRRSCRVVNSRL